MTIVSNRYLDEMPRTGLLCAALLQHFGCGSANIHIPANRLSLDGLPKLQSNMAHLQNIFQVPFVLCRRFGNPVWKENPMSRDWLAHLWLEEKRQKNVKTRTRRQQGSAQHSQYGNTVFDTLSSFQLPFMKSILSRTSPAEQGVQVERTFEQPPTSQYDVGYLSPKYPDEVKLAPLLARANLLITRDIEWANIMFSIEQESRYAIVDACYPQSPVGFIREQSNVIYRQLLRTRRPFVAYITDAMGNEVFSVRRPFWLINSSIYAEVDGKEVGVVHRRWHLWRRIYDLYLGNKQFAVVENPGFWNWTFTLKEEDDRMLAQIDRDWRGLGFELFTDAGQYVIRFGDTDSTPKSGLASEIEQVEVARPLTLSERAVAIALAVSLDCDYFSRRRGWGLPMFVVGE